VGDGIVFEPSTIARECPAQWTQAQIDLGELARLRQKGWTSKQLQAHFGFGRTKINLELRKLQGPKGAKWQTLCDHASQTGELLLKHI